MAWILYVIPGERNSEKALKHARKSLTIAVEDVRAPKNQLPEYVDGVPVLANTRDQELFKGTACLERLVVLVEDDVSPAPLRGGARGVHSFETAEPLSTHIQGVPLDDLEPPDTSTGKVTESDVTAYLARRRVVAPPKRQSDVTALAPPAENEC